jgi:hypothetical protein
MEEQRELRQDSCGHSYFEFSRSSLFSKDIQSVRHALVRNKGGPMKYRERVMLGLAMLAGVLAIGAAAAIGQTDGSHQQSQNKSTPKAVKGGSQDRGQQVFQQNCSRCHNAPEGLPSSISGTVALHMRVHARLSDSDYKALRQFLNP